MRAVLLDVPAHLLEERRRLGLDRRDEMWTGVLHVVPPPSGSHQGLSTELLLVLGPVAKAAGLLPRMEPGLFDPEVADLMTAGCRGGARCRRLAHPHRPTGGRAHRRRAGA